MFKKNDLLLFIGDSVTHAHRRDNEVHDCYLLGSGFVNHIAAVLGKDWPDYNLKFINRGECGHATIELEKRWQTDCLELRPDVLNVLIGINDASRSVPQSPEQFRENYRRLLHQARARMPRLRIVLLEPFGLAVSKAPPAPVLAATAEQLHRLAELQPVVAELAEEFGARFVPLQAAFDQALEFAPAEHWMLDGIHPSAAGHALITGEWFKCVVGAPPRPNVCLVP